MKIRGLSCLLLTIAASVSSLVAQEDAESESFDSPDERFVLKVSVPKEGDAKLEVLEKASGKVVGDLGTEYPSILSHIKVVWSDDSKRLAYRTAGVKDWSTNVYFWDGSAFKYVALPEKLPSPHLEFRKSDEHGGVKNYGGGKEPVRWLKSGDLELLGEERQMARESSRTYTATITITIAFDAQNRAKLKSVSKSKMRVD